MAWDFGIRFSFSSEMETVSDIKDKLKLGHTKIVANRSGYNRPASRNVHLTFCDHCIVFVSGRYSLLRENDLS
jgi:hypothetical protein